MSTPLWKATQGTGDQTLKDKNQHRSLRLADILTTTSKAEAMASNLTEEDSNRVEEVSNKEADSSKTGEFPQRGGFALTRRPFCRTCYDSNKGKDTYLMHATTSPTYPSRQQFSSIDTYPQEVLETGDYMLPGNEVMDDQVWLDWLVDAGWLILTGWYWLVDTGWLILAGWYWLGMLHRVHCAIFHCGVLIGRNRGCGVVHVLLVLCVVRVMIIVHILHMHVLRVVNVWYCT